MKKLQKLPKKEISQITTEIIKSLMDFQRTPSNINAVFKKRGILPPSDATIYRFRKQIRQEEQMSKHAANNGVMFDKQDFISLSKIMVIKDLREEIGEERFKQILSLIM